VDIVLVILLLAFGIATAIPLAILLIIRRHTRRMFEAARTYQPGSAGRYRGGSGGGSGSSSDNSWVYWGRAGTHDSGWSGSYSDSWSSNDYSSSSGSCDSSSSSSSDSGSSSSSSSDSSSSSSSSCD
jgi:hypothetical protein